MNVQGKPGEKGRQENAVNATGMFITEYGFCISGKYPEIDGTSGTRRL